MNRNPTSPQGLQYRPDIDGLRALAILSVLAFHADRALLPGGFCGVDVFFVISGFLITGIIVRELESDSFSFGHFYARRVRRLFPALALVLLTTLVLGWLILLPDEFQTLGTDVAAGAAFSSNLLQYSDVSVYFGSVSRPLMHLWSLGVEEQFYFLWPVLIYTTWKFRRRWLGVIAAAVIAASFLENVAVVSFDPQAAFFLPWSRLWELSLGACLATSQYYRQQRSFLDDRSNHATVVGWLLQHRRELYWACGATLLLASFLLMKGTWEFPGFWALVPSIGTALIILAGPQAWFNRRILSLRPVVFIGLVSYPLYLWHWSLLCFARLIEPAPSRLLTGAVLIVSFGLAVATYLFIELPLRRSRRRQRTLAVLCFTLACCGVLGYLVSIQYIAARPIPLDVQRLTLPRDEDWLSTQSKSWTVLPKNYVESGKSTTKTLFIGDSLMEQYYPRIQRIESDSPRGANSAVFAVRAACSFAYEFSWPYGRASCKRHIQKALEYAKRDDVDTVVFASAWPSYFMTLRQGKPALNPAAAPALARFKQTVADLRKLNKRVFIVLVEPIDDSLDPRSRIQRTVFSPGFRVVDVPLLPKTEFESRGAVIEAALRQVAHDEGAIIIDPIQEICYARACPAFTPNDEAIYHDAGHLRPSFVREHAQFMDETVLRYPLHTLSHSVR